MTIAPNVFPKESNGACKISKTNWKALPYGVKAKIQLTAKKTNTTTPAGINAEKDCSTVGGTPSGILMTQPLELTHA